ncbi:hypothetical protein SDC9_196388 [bioreactor metagenome]|uniref:Uncharacterized protein n=1 Tax=bioreactor metagenome TaxID=1076179 RepID=A0A645ICY8_9ZZZZ
MSSGTDGFCRFNQRGGAFKVSDCRILHRRKVQARTIQTNGRRGDQNIADIDMRLNGPRGANTQESTNAQLSQFFHRYRS